uniref:Uncharacterized protein n=1 Tax=Tetranychus urticae TaxID=32264 RepID=T1K9F9_TETUR
MIIDLTFIYGYHAFTNQHIIKTIV